MQTALLGLGIAIILALVAALVGPYVVDWNQYRTAFEAEAGRLTGLSVRIAGPIDARILPTPTLVLHDVEFRRADGDVRLRAGELGMALALGPLLRGEWRAAEMHLTNPEFRLGLDDQGRIDWSDATFGIDPDRISAEKFTINNGRAILSEAASGARRVLEKLSFNGEIHSLIGPLSGDGEFAANGEAYKYRIVAGRLAEDGSLKLHLALDPLTRPLTIETDGSLAFEHGAPNFTGTFTMARLAVFAPLEGATIVSVPWQLTGKIKASARNALCEQIEFQYGSQEQPVKLTGAAEIKLGKNPNFNGVLSARQIDADRALALPEPSRRLPLAALRAAAEAFGSAVKPPIPGRFGIGIDSVILAGTALQAVRGDFKADAQGWDLETFEFRAPGFSQARMSGRLDFKNPDGAFSGLATIEAGDPKTLLAWIEGRPDVSAGQIGALRVSGAVNVDDEHIAVDQLKIQADNKTVEGRLAYRFAGDKRAARFETQLKAAQLNVDAVIDAVHAALADIKFDRPAEMVLAADIDNATIAGLDAKNTSIKLRLDADRLAIERISIGDLGGASFDLDGRLDALSTTPKGLLTLNLNAQNLNGAMALLSTFAPDSVDLIKRAAPRLVPLRLHGTLSVGEPDASLAKLAMTGTGGAMHFHLAGDLLSKPGMLKPHDVSLEGQIGSDDGAAVIALLGLDRLYDADKGAGTITLAAHGPLDGDLRIDMQGAAGGISAQAGGIAHGLIDGIPTLTLDTSLAVTDARRFNVAALTHPADPLPLLLRSRLTVAHGEWHLDDVSGTFADSPLRGRLTISHDSPVRIGGALDFETLNAAALFGASIGAPHQAGEGGNASAPRSELFTPGVFDGLTGAIDIKAAHANLTPALSAQDAKGRLSFSGKGVAFDDVEAELAGGRIKAQLSVTRPDKMVAARGRLVLTDADAAAIFPGDPRPAIDGRLTLALEAEGEGFGPASLVAALKGGGTVTLNGAQLAMLNPKVFDVLIRKVDQGLPVDVAKIGDAASTALGEGNLDIARADAALTIAGGQIHLANTLVHGAGADVAIAGNLELADRTLDARLTLSGPASPDMSNVGRPELSLALKGSITAAKRTLDVSALTGWLVLRSVDRQTQRLEAIESDRHEQDLRSAVPPAVPLPALPPPIEVKPVPSNASTGNAAHTAPRKTTGQSTPPPKSAVESEPPPAPSPPKRSLLDSLFGGTQR